jgi:hypothetical protein
MRSRSTRAAVLPIPDGCSARDRALLRTANWLLAFGSRRLVSTVTCVVAAGVIELDRREVDGAGREAVRR